MCNLEYKLLLEWLNEKCVFISYWRSLLKSGLFLLRKRLLCAEKVRIYWLMCMAKVIRTETNNKNDSINLL